MDAERRDAERAARTNQDVSARAREVTARLRAGEITREDLYIRGILGDAGAAQAIGEQPGDWSETACGAERLGNALALRRCLRLSLALLRYTRDNGWSSTLHPGTPAWEAYWWTKIEQGERPLYPRGEVRIRENSDASMIRVIGTRKSDGQRFGVELPVHESEGERGRTEARRALLRDLHRHAGLPGLGVLARVSRVIEAAIVHALEQGSTLLPPSVRESLRLTSNVVNLEVQNTPWSPETAWMLAPVRMEDDIASHEDLIGAQRDLTRRTYTLASGRVVTDQQIYDSSLSRGYWLCEQVRSAARFVGGVEAVRAKLDEWLTHEVPRVGALP